MSYDFERIHLLLSCVKMAAEVAPSGHFPFVKAAGDELRQMQDTEESTDDSETIQPAAIPSNTYDDTQNTDQQRRI